MASLAPWTTCLLTEMLIRQLEEHYPDATRSVDYRKILSAAEVIQDIPEPQAFLTDPNNWVPHTVLRELIRSCETATGEKDFCYLAARAYYRAAQRRTPTLLETIAILLKDVERVLSSAGHWASGYTNYLQMQAFARPGEPQTLYILSQYRSAVEPLTGNTRLVQGNIEGIATVDPQVTAVSSEEQLSQVRLATLVTEFGDKYVLNSNAQRTTVTERATGKVIAVAKSVVLDTEWVPCSKPSLPTSPHGEEQSVVTPDAQGGLRVLAPNSVPGPTSSRAGEATAAVRALRIERGGTLTSGTLHLTLQEDAIYDAPYSRFRVHWQKAESAKDQAVSGTRESTASEQEALAYLLFNHLKNLQDTQRRTLSMVIRNVELAQENVQLKQELSAQQETGGLIGKSKALQEVLALIRTIAASDSTVLITGETGTGKELAARLIHQLNRRHKHRFVAVNCGALPETLLESELFGHERGAFTGAVAQKKGKFELAEGGTLFLDEIGDISPAVQVKLLRVLQEKEFQRVGGTVDLKADVRVIAATNRDLDALIEQKQFRRDLYYRLNVIQLYLPLLRERTEDIPELAQHFIHRCAEQAGKLMKGLTADALDFCLAYKWPGNIRELENVMERAVTLAPDHSHWITPDLLPPYLRQVPATTAPRMDVMEFVKHIEWSTLRLALRKSGSLSTLLGQVEWAITSRAIEEYGGNKSRAARTLGRTYRWLRKLESEMTESQPPSSPPD